jgi:GNAT superfamily N-acetyltransferase
MTRSVLLRLRKTGIEIEPYILYREDVGDTEISDKPEYTVTGIEPEDTDKVAAALDDPSVTAAAWRDRIANGQLGLLLSRGDEVIGYTWADTRFCSLVNPRNTLFELRDGQAYLRYTFVKQSFRGKDLAPYLRGCMYRELHGRGYREFFSVSEFFNRPARSFKKKLGAVPLQLRVSILLFHRWGFDARLRNYRSGGDSVDRVLPRIKPLKAMRKQ